MSLIQWKPTKAKRLLLASVIVILGLLLFLSIFVAHYSTTKSFLLSSFNARTLGFNVPKTSFASKQRLHLLEDVPPYCSGNQTEIRQVVFDKVHKAASSTLQNILLRFAVARELDILLPKKGWQLNGTGKAVSPNNIIQHPQGKLFDILCQHLVYSAEVIDKYFPRSAIRVAILREPLRQSLSALKYYSTVYSEPSIVAGVRKHPDDPINGFLTHPEDFFPPNKTCNQPGVAINSRMSYDLGFDVHGFAAAKKNATRIKQFLAEVERQFDLVLIADHFDESMVLLRRALGWSMKDIIYLKVNTDKTKRNSQWDRKPVLNSTIARNFRLCNNLDYELYERFLPIFWEKVKKQRLFHEEVAYFKKTNEAISDFCSTANRTVFHEPESVWSSNFTVSKNDCKLMSLTEIEFTNLAREKLLLRYKRLKLSSNSSKTSPKPQLYATMAFFYYYYKLYQ